MKYTGENADSFEREARMMLAFFENQHADEYGRTLEDCARELARDYGIGDSEIWDILPEYEAEVANHE